MEKRNIEEDDIDAVIQILNSTEKDIAPREDVPPAETPVKPRVVTAETPPRTADSPKAKTAAPPLGSITWQVKPDALPLPKGKLLMKPLTLRGKAVEARDVLFTQTDPPQAMVLFDPTRTALGAPTRPNHYLDRYDLATGKHLGSLNALGTGVFGAVAMPLDALGADGKLFAHSNDPTGGSVTVWSVPESKTLVTWKPFDKGVRWMGMTGTDRLWIQSVAGEVKLWTLPNAQAEIALEKKYPSQAAALSATGKYLALPITSTIDILDARTGECHGQVTCPSTDTLSCLHLAFSKDGNALAALVFLKNGQRSLVVWDLKTGEVSADVLVPITFRAGIQWVGPNYVLVTGEYLVDVARKALVWQYKIDGFWQHSTNSPDGRFWFANSRDGKESALLYSQTIPDKKFADALAGANDPKACVRPGIEISVKFDFAGPAPDPASFNAGVKELVLNSLKKVDLKVAEGKSPTLVISAKEVDTMQVREIYHSRTKRKEKYPIKELSCELSFLNEKGAAVWKAEKVFKNNRIDSTTNKSKGELTSYLSRDLWNSLSVWLQTQTIPFYVSQDGKAVLPGASNLPGQR